jgi:hypothetical protein
MRYPMALDGVRWSLFLANGHHADTARRVRFELRRLDGTAPAAEVRGVR